MSDVSRLHGITAIYFNENSLRYHVKDRAGQHGGRISKDNVGRLKWLYDIGSHLIFGAPLAEIEFSDDTAIITSPADGILMKKCVTGGDYISNNIVIGYILEI